MKTPSHSGLGPEAIDLDGKTILVVGRGSSANVQLPHPAVSRRHSRLHRDRDRIVICDLQSRSGTRINGLVIHEAYSLQQGDRVEFGPIAYRLVGQQLRRQDQPGGVLLEANGLVVARRQVELLRDINVTLHPGHFVGILGPSGSGKTTLLKCLAGFYPPQAGHLRFDDKYDVQANLDSYRHITGYVPQDDLLYGPLTGRENLDFALRLRSPEYLPAKDRHQIITQILKRLHLSDHADKPVTVLSGGQRKRFNVAMELLTQPRILFLDEPTSGLDPAGETRLMTLLKKEAANGTTVICSTHVMENLQLFDAVVVLAQKKVVYAGEPAELLRHFKMATYTDLYEVLESYPGSPAPIKEPPVRSKQPPPLPLPLTSKVLQSVTLVPLDAPRPAQISTIGLGIQIQVQFLRGMWLILRDRFLLLLLLGQPLAIGLIINLSQQGPTGVDSIFVFAVVTSIWLGLNNTAREVVRDRPLYVRERMAGVTPGGYLIAKLLLYATVGLIQLTLLLFLLRHANLLSSADVEAVRRQAFAYQLLVLWTSYLAAMLLGLLVSTLANSQETAVAALPLIVLPQLLLTGVATALGSIRDGRFSSLVLLFNPAKAVSRSFWQWLLEWVSLLTFSRPSLALLQHIRPDQTPVAVGLLRLVDWLHLLFLVLLTAALLAAAFLWREKHWREQG